MYYELFTLNKLDSPGLLQDVQRRQRHGLMDIRTSASKAFEDRRSRDSRERSGDSNHSCNDYASIVLSRSSLTFAFSGSGTDGKREKSDMDM